MSKSNDIEKRGAFLAQALATMGDARDWDIAVTNWVACYVRSVAQEEFGRYAKAHEMLEQFERNMGSQHAGQWAIVRKSNAEWQALKASHDAEQSRLVERYYGPLWQAGRELALVPAPTLSAAVFKALLIEREEIWNDSGFGADSIEIIEADFARVATVPNGAQHSAASTAPLTKTCTECARS